METLTSCVGGGSQKIQAAAMGAENGASTSSIGGHSAACTHTPCGRRYRIVSGTSSVLRIGLPEPGRYNTSGAWPDQYDSQCRPRW